MATQSVKAAAKCRECRRLRKSLESTSLVVRGFLDALDAEMKQRCESRELGKRVAALANKLDMANDRIRYFDLNIDFRTDKKPPVSEGVVDEAANRSRP